MEYYYSSYLYYTTMNGGIQAGIGGYKVVACGSCGNGLHKEIQWPQEVEYISPLTTSVYVHMVIITAYT